MATLIRKMGRLVVKVSKRNHAENLRVAARIPISYYRLRNMAIKHYVEETRSRVLQEKELNKSFRMRNIGSQFIELRSEGNGLKDISKFEPPPFLTHFSLN